MTVEEATIRQGDTVNHSQSRYLTWFGILLTVGSLVAALWGIDFQAILNSLTRLDIRFLILALFSVLLTNAAKALRWKSVLSLGKRGSFKRIFTVLNISLLLNSFAPARLGDLARVAFFGQLEGESNTFVLGTIVVEKVSDLLGLILAMVVLPLVLPLPEWFLLPTRGLLSTVIVLFCVLLLLTWQSGFLLRIAEKYQKTPYVGWAFHDVVRAFQKISSPARSKASPQFILWTLVMPFLGALTNLLVFRAFGFSLNFGPALFLLVVIMLGISLPSAPGRFGLFHYLTVLALTPFGISKSTGLAFGIVLHLVVYLPTVLLGGIGFWQERSSLYRLSIPLLIWKARFNKKSTSSN